MAELKEAFYDLDHPAFIKVGMCALVWPIVHRDYEYVSCNSYAMTSVVQEHDMTTGVFTTQNTRYKPLYLRHIS